MKKGINRWAFREELPLVNVFRLAKETGFEGVEVNLEEEGEVSLNSTEQDIRQVADLARKERVEISSISTGLLWQYPLTSSDPAKRDKGKQVVTKMIEVASWLGLEVVLVVPGAVDIFFLPDAEVVPYDQARERSLEALKELAKVAEEKKIFIGVENVWNKMLLSPLEMKQFIEEIGSDQVGLYFDVGNVMLVGFPEQWIRILADRLLQVHLKDFKCAVGNIEGFVNLLEGDVNWPEVIKALNEIGYEGYLVAEYFPTKHHPEALLWNTSKSMDFIMQR